MANTTKIKEFYLWDFEGTLFPMETCRLLIEHRADALDEYIKKIVDPAQTQHSFLSQETVYANKAQYHLRRTMKLDPVAEYYLYKMGYENRGVFRKSHSENRMNFGYRYADGNPISIHDGFKDFKDTAKIFEEKYQYYIKFDIASYFNSIYHHDLTNWFSSLNVTNEQNELFGKFMREINTGFSIDFLPHGLYPSKMLGSHFLNFVDNSGLIKCEQTIRFMDDYILYSDSKEVLVKDFQVIQKILGQKSLNINSDKTVLFHEESLSISDEVSDIKSRIIEKVRISSGSGMDYEEYEEVVRQLSDEEITYLVNLLNDEEATDSEASLILDCIHEHSDDFENYLPVFINRFPHLAKKVFHKCADVDPSKRNELAGKFCELLSDAYSLNEYQLFWVTKITEKYLLGTKSAGSILSQLYEHKNATMITKAKLLEIPEQRFGMPEWREVHLKNGSSSWLSWASAIGMRNDTKQNRNYLLKYFAKISPMNSLIADYVLSQ